MKKNKYKFHKMVREVKITINNNDELHFQRRKKETQMNSGIELLFVRLFGCNVSIFEDWKIYTKPAIIVNCLSTCDGLWTVIQKRFDGPVDFLADYKEGFGEASGKYGLAIN